MSTVHLPEFTIRPTDRPQSIARCSRCGESIGAAASVVQWNKKEFWYCRGCAPTMAASAHQQGSAT